MEIAHDLRHAAARMLKAPGLPLGAVLAIGIGLGGAVAVFRVIDVALFSPLELQQANGVFVVTERRASGEVFERISPDELNVLRSPDSPFESVAAVTTDTVTMTAPGDALLAAPRLGGMLMLVNPRDPSIVGIAVGLLSTVALLAVFPLANRIAIAPHAFFATGGDRRV